MRHVFIGRFERVGYKKSYRYCRPTLLLTHVALAETGELITDHLWLNYTKGFLDLGELLTGDLLRGLPATSKVILAPPKNLTTR